MVGRDVSERAIPLWLAYLCLALSMSLVGSYVALSKPMMAALPVFLLAWLRFGIGAAAMLHWLKKPAHEPPLTRRTKGLLFLESFLGNFLFTLCMLAGLRLTSAVAAGVIMAAIPAVVALLSWVFLRERIGVRVWLAIACAVGGMGLLALPSGPGGDTGPSPSSVWGNVLVFGAVLCEASYAVIGKRLTAAMTPRRITALINLWGLALMTPLGLAAAWGFDFGAVPRHIWALLLFYALAASVWTVWLWMTGLRSVPAAQAGVFMVMLPLSTAVVGIVILGESVSRWQALAFAFALSGLLLATLPRRAPRADATGRAAPRRL